MKELCRKTCLHSINRFKLLVAQFFVLFFLPLHCFNWKIVAFKNFEVFCHTSSRINHRYTPMSPPSRTSCPSLSPSHPSRLYTAPVLVPWVIWQIPIGYVCYIWYYTFPCYFLHTFWGPTGFPGGASDKESTCQCRRRKRCGFDPCIPKIPCSRKWQPAPIFLSGKFHG